MILLFPEPFGPVIPIKRPSKFTLTGLEPNDLKPRVSTFLIYTIYINQINTAIVSMSLTNISYINPDNRIIFTE